MRRYRFLDDEDERSRRKEKYLELRQKDLALKEREIAAKEERNRLRKQAIAAEKAKERAIKLRYLLDKFSITNAVSLIAKITATATGLLILLRQLAEFNPNAARVYLLLTNRLSRAVEAIVNGSSSAATKAINIIDMIISKLKREGR